MKKIFERWNRFIDDEKKANMQAMRSFTFTAAEVKILNRSIAKIVNAAKKVLGADGPTPLLSMNNLEKIELDSTQKDATPMKMVAEQDDELESLRQKYYGPGGDIEKFGPRAVKGAEKGIGQMSAQDFEKAGYVLKVPQEVLDDFQMMIQETKKTGELYTQARDWYHNIRDLLDQETNDDRDSALLGLLIATYSPRAKFALNLAEAAFMFKAVQKDASENPDMLKQYLETFPGAEKREPGEARGFTKASKVPNFALNLVAPNLAGERDKETGDMSYNDMYMWNSTIDTWMIDAFYPMIKKASTSKEWEALKGKLMSNVVSYRYMARLVAQEAKKLGLLPHELQAIVWVSMQVRQTGDPGLGVTTEFAINQIKDSIRNIKQINQDLADIEREFEEKSWLGTLFDEIDGKGFEEAGKFLLGVKNEKGKVTVPGVRSLTSRGKKGSAYKYYPTPEAPVAKPKAVRAKKPAGEPRPKPPKAYADSKFSELNTWYVMNEIIQMPTGKFNNLYDSIMLYLNPDFSTQAAVDYITGRFDPEATATSKYFTENKKRLSENDIGGNEINAKRGNDMATIMHNFKNYTSTGDDGTKSVKAVLHRNGVALLLKNEKGWDLPGGHIKTDEGALEGLQREIYEETGLMIDQVVDLHITHKNKEFYEGEFPRDDIILSDEHSEYGFFNLEQVKNLPDISPHYRKIVIACLTGVYDG